MVSISTQIAGFAFDNCLMNAAGVACMTKEELAEVKDSAAGTFVTKTATLEFRQGNPEPRYQDVPLGSINSMGLPNNGLDYYLEYLLELQESEPNRTFFLSLVGMSPEETHTILKKVQVSDFKGITELNLSCPNVPGKPQIAYDFETTEKILSEVFAYFTKPLGIKLPPYFDIVHFDQAAAIFNKYPLKFVGGQYIKPTALANVHAFYQRLKPEIQIIGTGGVLTGRDAFEHILCGASMVQVGTTLHKEGVAAFERITAELKAIMEEKGYESLEDFQGKLKYIE